MINSPDPSDHPSFYDPEWGIKAPVDYDSYDEDQAYEQRMLRRRDREESEKSDD